MRRWEQGRQRSGYWKLKIISFEPYFDLYLLKYPRGAYIPLHRDPVLGRRHYRVNIVLKKAEAGGEFRCDKALFSWGRIVVFRSDIHPHEVAPVWRGCRYVLSLGVSSGVPSVHEEDWEFSGRRLHS